MKISTHIAIGSLVLVLGAPAFAQSPLTSIRPVRSQTQADPLLILPGGRVRSAPATTATEAACEA